MSLLCFPEQEKTPSTLDGRRTNVLGLGNLGGKTRSAKCAE